MSVQDHLESVLASSPYAKRGALWQAYRNHYGRDASRVLVWKAASLEMNPRFNPDVVTRAYEDDPQAAAAEWGGDFRNDVAAFVAREVDGSINLAESAVS